MNKITSPVIISILVVGIAAYIVYSKSSKTVQTDVEQFSNPTLPTPEGGIPSGPPGDTEQVNSLQRSTETESTPPSYY